MMKFDESILKYDEKAVLTLRKLYSEAGYRQFKMSKFEEYDLYSRNKEFLVSDGVITFNDTDGKLLALKPDVTLSIIKNSRDTGETEKFYYNENVYRISETSHTYKEIIQTGLECIGNITREEIFEVVNLAAQSLSLISDGFMLNISHIGLINSLLGDYGIRPTNEILTAISEKNAGLLKSIFTKEQFDALKVLVKNYERNCDRICDIKMHYKRSSLLQ